MLPGLRAAPVVRRRAARAPPAAAARRVSHTPRPAPAARRACRARRCGRVSSTRMASARRTVDSRCAITSDVRLSISVESASCTSISDSVSSDEVASSRIRIGALRRIARAIASRCRCPPERRWPRSPIIGLVAAVELHDELVGVRRARRRLDLLLRAPRDARRRCWPRRVSSKSTVSCVTIAICARSDASVTSRTSTPSMRMAPPVTS